jgi:hypothetical protein
VHVAMKNIMFRRAAAACVALLAANSAALAQSAYITQAPVHSAGAESNMMLQSMQTMPAAQYAPSQRGYVPTPELATPHNGNVAQTLQIGNYNRVYQSQSGGGNFSNVAIVGNSNNVGVWQGGQDFSNLALVNMQGLSVGVLQPRGAAPLNMLIARLPNGSLLIKR